MSLSRTTKLKVVSIYDVIIDDYKLCLKKKHRYRNN